MVAPEIIVKVVLFIGLLLLCIGIVYYSYDKFFFKKEGFQTTGPITLESCSQVPTYIGPQCCDNPYASFESTCDANCAGVTTKSESPYQQNPTIIDKLPPETDDEKIAYDVYEEYNLQDLTNLAYPPDLIPTTNVPYVREQGLSPFDFSMGQSVPWDFDNSILLPADVLWGSVTPVASQGLFTKCQSQAALGNINNLNFNAEGNPYYTSQYFDTTFNDSQSAMPFQYLDFFVDFYAETLFETMIDKGMTSPFKEGSAIERFKILDYEKAYNSKLAGNLKPSIADTKAARAYAKDVVATKKAAGEYKKLYAESQRIGELMSKYKNIGYVRAAKQFGPLGPIKKFALINQATEATVSAVDAEWEAKNTAKKAAVKESRAALKANVAAGTAETASRLKYLRPGKVIAGYKSLGKGYRIVGSQIAKVVGKVLDRLGITAISKALGAIKARMYRAIEQAIIAIFKLQATAAPLAALGPVGWAIDAVITVLSIGCVTFIPAIFNSFIDQDAVCPYDKNGHQLYSIICDIQASAAGGIGLNILEAIPLFGDVLYAFGQFICLPVANDFYGQAGMKYYKSDSTAQPQLAQNLVSPIYYNDSTLSIFALIGNPNGNGPGEGTGFAGQFTAGSKGDAGSIDTDKRLYDYRTFHLCPTVRNPPPANPLACRFQSSVTCGYGVMPLYIWVDFSNQIMLDRMAQFYFDTSRKFAQTTRDGYVQFEYISKFYGLISTTELSCDVLCEITVVKFDPVTGIQVCSAIQSNFGDPSLYSASNKENLKIKGQYMHDRRFYFALDKNRGYSPTERATKCGGGGPLKVAPFAVNDDQSLDNCMNDNYEKYIVTGCTHVDGTAPDALLRTSEGDTTETPIIGLGTPTQFCYGKNNCTPFQNLRSAGSTTYYEPILVTETDGNGNCVSSNGKCSKLAIPSQVPKDSTCAGLVATYTKYGTTPDAGAPSLTTAPQLNNNNITVVQNDTPSTWKYDYSIYSGQLPISPSLLSGVVKVPVYDSNGNKLSQKAVGYPTKFKSISIQGCFPWDNACIIGLQNSRAGMAVQMTLGYLPYAYGEIGGIVTTTAQVIGAASAAQCAMSQAVTMSGAFVLNGANVTAKPLPTAYLNYQGPVADYAPGYIPNIQKCKNQPLELYDCVNRHAVRAFVKAYEDEHKDRAVSIISNITPRKVTTCPEYYCTPDSYPAKSKGPRCNSVVNANDKDQPFVNSDYDLVFPPNPISMCVYDISYNIIDPITFAVTSSKPTHDIVGIAVEQDQNVCTFSPVIPPAGSAFYTNNNTIARRGEIPYIEPYKRNMASMVIGLTPKDTTTSLTIPIGCTKTSLKCSDIDLQNYLVSSFNMTHLDYPIMISTSVTNQQLFIDTNGLQYCKYRAHFSSVFNPVPDSNGNYYSSNISRDVTFALASTTVKNACLYDLDFDDFPLYTSYTPMPQRDRWFTLPAKVPAYNNNFLPGCKQSSNCYRAPAGSCTEFSTNCTNPTLIANVVGQFNKRYTDKKIIQVNRAYTPANSTPVCDFDVQIMRTMPTIGSNPANVVENETIRLNLKENSLKKCLYDLDASNLNVLNKGYSLNASETLGMLNTPYIWATSYAAEVTSNVTTYVKSWLGLDVKGVIDGSVNQSFNQIEDLRKLVNTSISLKGCGTMTCHNSDWLISSMVNRYNFDNYPSYDLINYPATNAVQKRTIVQVLRSGNASPLNCQLQLFEKIEIFPDFMYGAGSPNTQYWMRYYQFDLSTLAGCNFKIRPFTPRDISDNIMDVSGMSYAIQDDSTRLNPSWNTASVGGYAEAMIPCGSQDVFNAVVAAYNRIPVGGVPPTTADGTIIPQQYNNIDNQGGVPSFMYAFNAMPNVCEYYLSVYHTYYDTEFSNVYQTGPDKTFIVATWPTDTQNPNTITPNCPLAVSQGVIGPQYDVDTGYYYLSSGQFVPNGTPGAVIGKPVIQEFFFPNLQVTANGFADANGNKVLLPYLANDDPDVIPIRTNTSPDTRWKAIRGTNATTI